MTVSQKDGLVLLMVIAADALVNLSTWTPDRWAGLGWLEGVSLSGSSRL